MNDLDESYFDWSDEEDIICSSKYISSDEDDDDVEATINAHRKFAKRSGSVFGNKQKQKQRHVEEEEDDFEKEMATELSQTMQHLASSLGMPSSSGASQPPGEGTVKASEFYDEVYFDSDESDSEETGPGQAGKKAEQTSHRRQHKVLTNDELFYDPTMDDRDQEWVNQKRRSYQPRGRRPGRMLGVENNNTIQLPPSDAVLNCPACLTTLCMDCQRHEVYHNQYRAMFVFNCVVDATERLSYPSKDQKRREFLKNKKAKKNKKLLPQEGVEDTKGDQERTEGEAAASTTDPTQKGDEAQNNLPTNSANSDTSVRGLGKDMFHPVMCKICNTKVAVYDSDEVYHFFNVVTSY